MELCFLGANPLKTTSSSHWSKVFLMPFCVFCFVLMTMLLELFPGLPERSGLLFSLLAIHMVSRKCSFCPFPSAFEAALFADFSSSLSL